jgi:CubicO group peptidase (beta-lactamase class C family)
MTRTALRSTVALLVALRVLTGAAPAQETTPLTPDEVAALEAVLVPLDRADAPGGAVAVWRDGALVFTAARGLADLERNVPLTPEAVFDIASTSKQFTAAAILLLERDGLLDLAAPLHELLPGFVVHEPPVRLAHLVAHQSGLADYLWLMALCGHDDASHYELDDVLPRLARMQRTVFAPGTRYEYSNTNYLLMASVVAEVADQPFSDFVQQRIFAPLGMQNSHVHDDVARIVPRRALGYSGTPGQYVNSVTPLELVGDGAVLTNVYDLFLWSQHFRPNRDGATYLWDAATTERQLAPFPFADGRPGDYAFGLDVQPIAAGRLVSHSGAFAGYRSDLVHCPEAGFGAAVLLNSDEFDPTGIAMRLLRSVGCDVAPLHTPPVVADARTPLTEAARALRGVWVDAQGVPFVLARDGDELVASGPLGGQRFVAAPAGGEFLVARDGSARLVPRTDGSGFTLVEGGIERSFTAPVPFAATAAALETILGTWRVVELDCLWEFEARPGRGDGPVGFDVRFPNDERLRGVVLSADLLRGPFSALMWRTERGFSSWSEQFGLLHLERPPVD